MAMLLMEVAFTATILLRLSRIISLQVTRQAGTVVVSTLTNLLRLSSKTRLTIIMAFTVVAEYPAWAIPSRRLFLAISFPTIGTVQVEIADLAGEYPARDFSPQRLPIITFSETLVALVVGSYAVRIQQTYRTISFRITLPIAAVVLIAPILAQPLRTTL